MISLQENLILQLAGKLSLECLASANPPTKSTPLTKILIAVQTDVSHHSYVVLHDWLAVQTLKAKKGSEGHL